MMPSATLNILHALFQTFFDAEMDQIVGTTQFLQRGLDFPDYRKEVAATINWIVKENDCLLHLVVDMEED